MAYDFSEEDGLGALVAGIDEVGRGPWAGPVVAAAVVLDRQALPDGLADSKALTAKRRESLSEAVRLTARIGIGEASPGEIDQIGLHKATLLAMARALAALPVSPCGVVVDGLHLPALPRGVKGRALPKADALCPSVSAASIVAKVHRDALMDRLHDRHDGYGWRTNKGYGTKEHQEGLARLGVTEHHRRRFAPVAALL